MMDAEMVRQIKQRLGITGTYHDTTLLRLADDVKAYMVSGGVKNKLVNSEASIGCIARGVADLWNYGAGDGRFSEVFYQRVIQLALPSSGLEDGSDEYDAIDDETIDEIVGKDVPNSDYATPEDIDNATKGENTGQTESDTEDFDGATNEEIDESLKENDDTVSKDEIDEAIGEDYEGLTNSEIDSLFKTF